MPKICLSNKALEGKVQSTYKERILSIRDLCKTCKQSNRHKLAGFTQNLNQFSPLIRSLIQNNTARIRTYTLNQTSIQQLLQITIKPHKIQITMIHKPRLIRTPQSLTQNIVNNLNTTSPSSNPLHFTQL
jgi:hypothetical protein